MVTIEVTTRSGEKRSIPARLGTSVMEAIRDAGIDDMVALCGGCCSCATCHVYVDESFADKVTPPNEPEGELLAASEYRTAGSRLSCQMTVTPEMDGLAVTLAPEE